MVKKKTKTKKNINFDKVSKIIPNINLDKFKIPKIISIEGTKKKIGNFYVNYKKEREKEKFVPLLFE